MAVPANQNLRITTGVLLVLAGLASIVFPFVSALALTMGFGAVAVVAGVSQLLRLGAIEGNSARLFRLLSALLYLGAGLYALLFPLDSSFSLTLFLGALLVVEAVMELALCSVRQAALHNHEGDGELPGKAAAEHHVEELLVETNQVAFG